MLKFKGTYEILAPEDIGLVRADSSGIVLGKLRYNAFACCKSTVECVARRVSFSAVMDETDPLRCFSCQWQTCTEVASLAGKNWRLLGSGVGMV